MKLELVLLWAGAVAFADAELCGTFRYEFDPSTHLCCSGMVFPIDSDYVVCCQDRIFGIGDPSAKQFWGCCEAEAFDNRLHHCYSGQLIAKANPGNPPPPPPPTPAPTTERTTTRAPTTTTTQPPPRRFPFTLPTRPVEPPQPPPPTQALVPVQPDNTCAGKTYDRNTRICCDGYIFVRSTPTTLCCGKSVFSINETDPEKNWNCCAEAIYHRRRQYCTREGTISDL